MPHEHWVPPTGLEPRSSGPATTWLVVVTLLAQGIVYYGHLETGLYLTVGLALLVGVAAGLRVDGIAAMAAAARREPQPSLWPTVSPLLVVTISTVLVGLVLAIPLGASGREGPDVLLVPLGAGLVVIIGSLLGWIVCGLVLWPVVHLVRGVLRIGGRDPEAELVTLPSVFFLLLVAEATVAVIAVGGAGDDVSGTPFGRGLDQLILTWTLDGTDPRQEALLMVARVLFVLMVMCGVAWIRRANRPTGQARTQPHLD